LPFANQKRNGSFPINLGKREVRFKVYFEREGENPSKHFRQYESGCSSSKQTKKVLKREWAKLH